MNERIKLISFDKEDYIKYYHEHLKGSLKWFIFIAIFLNLLIALPIHLMSGGKTLKIFEHFYCNMFVLCNGFLVVLYLLDLIGGYWSVINNLTGNNWGIPIVTFATFFVSYKYLNKTCSWEEVAIIFSVFISLCATQITIKCCK